MDCCLAVHTNITACYRCPFRMKRRHDSMQSFSNAKKAGRTLVSHEQAAFRYNFKHLSPQYTGNTVSFNKMLAADIGGNEVVVSC